MDTSNSTKVNTACRDNRRSASPGKLPRRHNPSSLSTAISEALHGQKVLERPHALACRVKDAGKEFLKHNQTCQWIQYMMEENPAAPPPQPSPSPSVKPPQQEEPIMPSKSSPPLSDIDQFSIPDLSLSLQEVGSYEEQLQILRKQQEELMEQQRRLQQQIEQQKKAHQLALQEEKLKRHCCKMQATEEQQTEGSGTSLVTSSSIYPPIPNRRRLKGNVAQNCAIRDEGSIGSLLWHAGDSAYSDRNIKRDRTPSSMDHTVYTSPTVEGRQIATSQESGTTVSQLLSHWPCDSCTEVTKNMSKSSESLLTQSTVKEPDDHYYSSANAPSLSSSTNDHTVIENQ